MPVPAVVSTMAGPTIAVAVAVAVAIVTLVVVLTAAVRQGFLGITAVPRVFRRTGHQLQRVGVVWPDKH